jgi:hypothetical protein
MRGRGCNVKAAKQGNWSVAGQVQDGTEVEAKSGILGPILRRGFGPLVESWDYFLKRKHQVELLVTFVWANTFPFVRKGGRLSAVGLLPPEA